MEPSDERNRIVDGIHNRGGPQLIQSSVNAFYYTNSSISVPQRPRTIPRPASRLFTGRHEVATKLTQAFAPIGDSCYRSQRRFVIYGLGGTGKSEICLKYASDHNDSYWGIFWIDCSNQSKAKEGFQRIAYLFRLPTPDFEATKDYLSSCGEKWLLILDNADDPEIDYLEYMPSQKGGDIIITTRNGDLADLYATVGKEHLDQLPLDLARDLLLQAAGVSRASWQDKAGAASAIVTELGRHTLAILQAASFIKQGCPIEDYIDEYREQKDWLFKFSRSQELSTYKTVHATFEISLLRLQSSGDAGDSHAKNALNLLNILSFMHFEGSFQQIFASATMRAVEIQQGKMPPESDSPLKLSEIHAKRLPQYFPKAQGSSLQWRQACNKLNMFSLIKMNSKDDVSIRIDIHPLLHTWARERQDLITQSQSWYTALLTLALSCPEDKTKRDLLYESMRSHIRACFTHRKMEYMQNLEPRTIPAVLMRLLWAQLLLDEDYQADELLALTEMELGNDSQTNFSVTKIMRGVMLHDQLHAKRKISSSEELEATPENLEILTVQALYLRQRGETLSALNILRQVSDNQKESLGHEHPDFLVSQCRLADIYIKIGRDGKAVEILEHSMPIAQNLTATDPLRLKYLDRLARAYRKNGRTTKAVSICEEIVEIDKQTLESTDLHRLRSQIVLAITYGSNSQHEKAVNLLEHVVSVQKQIVHDTHALVLETQYYLANAYWENGRHTDARALLEQVVEAESQEPKNWKALAFDLTALGRFCALDYQNERALELFKRASEADDKSGLDIWDPSRLISQRNLALMYGLTGKNEEETRVLESTVKIEGRDKIDIENKMLIDICNRLLEAYRSSGQFDKASSLEKRITSSEAVSKLRPRGDTINLAATGASQETLASGPVCRCGNKTVRLITGQHNPNGNAGKAYWKCRNPKCLRWCGWAS